MVDKKEKLEQLAEAIGNCQRCPLYKGATHAVPGEGNPDAQVMFIGEGPGYNEDIQGRPFVGQAGRFLDELIVSIGLKREDVFIGNVVKHRPPDNRDPDHSEIEACAEWLDAQIEIIDPPVVVTLGRFSMAKFTPGASISKIHGQPRRVGKRIVIPMYHPAAGLRSTVVAEDLKKDFFKIKEILDGNFALGELDGGEDAPGKKQDGSGEQMNLL